MAGASTFAGSTAAARVELHEVVIVSRVRAERSTPRHLAKLLAHAAPGGTEHEHAGLFVAPMTRRGVLEAQVATINDTQAGPVLRMESMLALVHCSGHRQLANLLAPHESTIKHMHGRWLCFLLPGWDGWLFDLHRHEGVRKIVDAVNAEAGADSARLGQMMPARVGLADAFSGALRVCPAPVPAPAPALAPAPAPAVASGKRKAAPFSLPTSFLQRATDAHQATRASAREEEEDDEEGATIESHTGDTTISEDISKPKPKQQELDDGASIVSSLSSSSMSLGGYQDDGVDDSDVELYDGAAEALGAAKRARTERAVPTEIIDLTQDSDEEPDAVVGEDGVEEVAGGQPPPPPHQLLLLLLPESTLYVRALTDGMVDAPTQSGRVSSTWLDKGKRINKAFKSSPWSDADGLHLDVTFTTADVEWVASGIQKRLQHLGTLYVDGSFETWSDPRLLQAVGGLPNLRELALPGRAITWHFPTCLPRVDTLHLMSSYGELPALSFVAPNVRVLTLAIFNNITFAITKGILKAFPNLKYLASERGWEGDWKARMAAAAAFNNRPNGWFDAIKIDRDENDEPHVVSTTMALPCYDEATGTIVRSPWSMREQYERLLEKKKGYKIEGDRLIVRQA